MGKIAAEWSKEENEYIRAHYPERGSILVGEVLGRTKNAVTQQALKLGVKSNRKRRTELDEQSVRYIRRNANQKDAVKLAYEINVAVKVVRAYMRANKIGKYDKEEELICEPPDSCFNCPFSDCIKEVRQVKQTSKEIEYHALGGIDTVGRGDGRRRV